MNPALAAIARDALLDHLDRGDARDALRRLVAGLSLALGRACQVQALAPPGREAWTEGSLPDAPATRLALRRLGAGLGVLTVQGSGAVEALELELQPVLPALAELLHRACAAPAGDAGQGEHGLRQAAELAAQEALTRLASIARSVPQVLFQSRSAPDGRREFLYLSDTCLEVLGLTPASLMADGDGLRRLILPEDMASLPAPVTPHGSGDLTTDYRIRRPDGEVRWLRVNSSFHAQDDGSALWHGSIEDITERRALQHSREEAAQARAASLAKTEFLARMSHELRTPLNAVLGFAQLMEVDKAEVPTPRQRQRLKLIREAGEHLLQMVTDMLDLTRIESGGMAVRSETVALRDLLQQTIELVRGAADKAQVSLWLAPGPDCAVLADRTRVRQVLLNLLSNAIKYNRPGGQVTVELTRMASGSGGGAERGEVAVHDTGLGISAAELPKVFDPFHRGDQASGAVEGAGIGLAVTRALVQRMGGGVSVDSTLGSGSVFRFWLPATEGSAPPAAAAAG